ncbi:MAG: hypothetical protein EOO22_10105 [Comamonadaceae bacterium]|nr:MAG: hypothetical protein EOO22_10105 [Comamonadaceae bacterium]
MMSTISMEKHAARAAEARRRIAAAAAMNESAMTRSEGDTAAILAGARAFLWLAAGTGKTASIAFIDNLIGQYGIATVMAAAVGLCRTQPAGPRAWLRQACATAGSRTTITSLRNH